MNEEKTVSRPDRAPDMDCPASGNYYRSNIWIKEDVVGFYEDDDEKWTYYMHIEMINKTGVLNYLEYVIADQRHPHRHMVIAYLAEQALLDD